MCVSRPLLPRISAVHFAHRVRTGGSQVALKGGHSVQFQTWVELKFATWKIASLLPLACAGIIIVRVAVAVDRFAITITIWYQFGLDCNRSGSAWMAAPAQSESRVNHM